MAEMTLKECCGKKPGDAVPVPTSPGFWLRRDEDRYGEVNCDDLMPVDRDEDGTLVWYWNGRPIDDSDRGSYYGPYRLMPASPAPSEVQAR